MTDNPFLDVRAAQNDDGTWYIMSSYWAVPAKDEKSAHKMVTLITKAYLYGQKSKANEIRLALGMAEMCDGW